MSWLQEFLRNMDSSQIAYDSFKNFLNKVSPRYWILRAFSFRAQLDRDWNKLANDWSDLVINLDESTKITFFKNKNKIKKINN